MKDQYVAAITIAVLAAGSGCAAYSLNSQSDLCPQPWSASVTALFAPCQAVYGAVYGGILGGSGVTPWGDAPAKADAMQTALLLTGDAPSSASDLSASDLPAADLPSSGLPAAVLAERLAASVDPFLRPSGS